MPKAGPTLSRSLPAPTLPAPSLPAERSLPRAAVRIALALRLVRLVALYGLLGAGLLGALLAWRAGQEAGWGTRSAAFPAAGPQTVGVTVDLLNAPPAAQRAALQRLAAAGVDWVRLRVGWETVEPAPGRFVWEPFDALLAAISRAGLEPLLVLDGSPPWARDSSESANPAAPAPPANTGDFARFAAAAAARYGAQVRLWQVWDEPNIAPHWGRRQIDPVGYAQLLRATAPALRAADADAYILTAALAPTRDRGHLAIDEVYFLQRMIAAGAVGSFDAVALQPFGFGDGPTITRQGVQRLNFQRLAVVRRALVAAGLPDLPIWAVRLGWNVRPDSAWGTVEPAARLRYAADARAVAAGWPWLRALGWAIDQPAAPESDPFWGFALEDDLLAAFATSAPPFEPAVSRLPPGLALGLALGVVAATVALGARAARRLPWAGWKAWYAGLPLWARLGLWGAAGLGYYAAVWPPLTGLWLLALALLAWTEPRWALVAGAALLPFHFFHKEIALPAGLTAAGRITLAPITAAALVLLPAALAAACQNVLLWRGHVLRRLRWSDWLALTWLALGLVSALNVWNWGAFGPALVEATLAPLVLYAAVRLFVRDEEDALYLALALVAGALLVALIGLGKWLAGAGVLVDGVLRLVGPQYSPNHTALWLVRGLVGGVGLLLAFRGAARKVLALALLPLAVALLLTASRGGLLLGLPAGGIALLWLWLLRDAPTPAPRLQGLQGLLARRGVRWMLGVAGLLALVGLLFGEARLLNQETVGSRLALWQAALGVWGAFPLVGAGPGGFAWNYPALLIPGGGVESNLLHPHNIWLELATGFGALGLVWLGALLSMWLAKSGRALPQAPRTRQALLLGLGATLVASLAHAQVDAFLALPDLAGWLFVALALVAFAATPGGAHAKPIAS